MTSRTAASTWLSRVDVFAELRHMRVVARWRCALQSGPHFAPSHRCKTTARNPAGTRTGTETAIQQARTRPRRRRTGRSETCASAGRGREMNSPRTSLPKYPGTVGDIGGERGNRITEQIQNPAHRELDGHVGTYMTNRCRVNAVGPGNTRIAWRH